MKQIQKYLMLAFLSILPALASAQYVVVHYNGSARPAILDYSTVKSISVDDGLYINVGCWAENVNERSADIMVSMIIPGNNRRLEGLTVDLLYGTDSAQVAQGEAIRLALPTDSLSIVEWCNVARTLDGLSDSTTYHCMVQAGYKSEVTNSNVATFTTWKKQARVSTREATDIAETAATLHGNVVGISTGELSSVGFVVAKDTLLLVSDSALVYTATIGEDFSCRAENLSEGTVYYYRAFAKVGGETTYGAVSSFKTRAILADKYLLGSYTAADYDLTTGEIEGDEYRVEIAQVEGNRISIYNLWGGENTIYATVDCENKRILTDPVSVVYVHPSYGNVWAEGLVITEEGGLNYYGNNQMLFYYDEEGNVVGLWGAACSAGFFGYYRTVFTPIAAGDSVMYAPARLAPRRDAATIKPLARPLPLLRSADAPSSAPQVATELQPMPIRREVEE